MICHVVVLEEPGLWTKMLFAGISVKMKEERVVGVKIHKVASL